MSTTRKRTSTSALSWLAGIGLAVCLPSLPAVASVMHYDIAFSGATTSGVLPTGSFDYDPAVPTFGNFTVAWDGVIFNMTAGANGPLLFAPQFDPALCGGVGSGPALSFLLLNKDSCLSTPPNQVGVKEWEIAITGSNLVFSFIGGGGDLLFFSSPQTPYDFAGQCSLTQQNPDCGTGPGWRLTETGKAPEPATFALIGLGLAGLGCSRRKRA